MNKLKSLLIATTCLCLTSINCEANINKLVSSLKHSEMETPRQHAGHDNRHVDNWMPVQFQISNELIAFKFPELENSFSYAGNDFYTLGTCTEASDLQGAVTDWELGYVASASILEVHENAQTVYDSIFEESDTSDGVEDAEEIPELTEYKLLINEKGTVDGKDFIELLIEYPRINHRVHVYLLFTDECCYNFICSYQIGNEDNLDIVINSIKIEKQ